MGRAEADIVGIAQNVVKALPPDISPPMVMRLAPSSIPVAMLQISSDNMTPASSIIWPTCESDPARDRAGNRPAAPVRRPGHAGVMVNLDQQKLLARHLTPTDIHNVLMKQYLVLPSGDIKIKSTDWIVLTNASPLKITDFGRSRSRGRQCVHLSARRCHGATHGPSAAERCGQGQTDRDHRCHEEHRGLDLGCGRWDQEDDPSRRAGFSAGVKIKLLDDASTFVKDSIFDVVRHAMALAGSSASSLLLHRLWRATVIVWTSIPLSILTAIIGLHWLNETINVMTLGGLALAVGILVDDATVMIENIDRHIEMGKPLEQAIIDAANQIVVPTLVATLCIAIVWIPLFELGGVAGYLFKPMAEAVIIAMLASFILSRTLVPTMAKYLMKSHHVRSRPWQPCSLRGTLVRFRRV